MKVVKVTLLLFLHFLSLGPEPTACDLIMDSFPSDFAFGVSSSAFPTEGSWDAERTTPNIWNTFTSNVNNFQGNGDATIAADGYNKFKEDVQLLKAVGVSHYRFSISWSRILPNGTKKDMTDVSLRSIEHYGHLVDELLANNITPIATLYDWDLPRVLQDMGGWANGASMSWFKDYADTCFFWLGDRIKLWITINDPFTMIYKGYETGEHAPGQQQPDLIYTLGHNILRAHAQVHSWYKFTYKQTQNGKVGIALNSDWFTSKTGTVEDNEAAERARQFRFGWFASPLFNGDYPLIMKERIALRSAEQGLGKSRLPTIGLLDLTIIKGGVDFVGINHYKTKTVSNKPPNPNAVPSPGFFNDQDLELETDLTYPKLEYRPELNPDSDRRLMGFGLKELLIWIKDNYNNPEVYVTENGLDSCGTMRDQNRIEYIREYSNNVLQAVQAGCNVKGYFVSSLMDGFNWADGYTTKTGLYFVDFDKDERPRFPRSSATFYKKLIANRGLNAELANYRAYHADRDVFHYGNFPNDFMWGASSSAYQVEGGWDADGKGPSIWDTWAHAGKISSNYTGDVSCDSYHLYMEDVANLQKLGVNLYRFSMAWSRILPDGTISSLNQAGVDYYNNLINALLQENIVPMVTLYHWDLPQALQDHDGWRNDSIIQRYEDYAKLCFQLFGDRVKYWLTFNEPFVFAWQGYGYGGSAPGIWDAGWGVYRVAHNIIRSHSRAYNVYKTQFQSTQGGKIGITLDIEWKEGLTDSPEDAAAAERAIQFKLGWFANAIFKNGDYPDVMKQYVAQKSAAQGTISRLPTFTDDEKRLNNGSFDFFGMNHYTSSLISDKPWPESWANYELDQDLEQRYDTCWWPDNDWNRFNPWGIRYILRWVMDKYNNPPLFITENGYGTRQVLDDDIRITYHKYYLNELMKAINEDGVNVKGYSLWSLMDSCEWNAGYWAHFGLYQVDFDDPNRPRTARKSAGWYTSIIKDNGFPVPSP